MIENSLNCLDGLRRELEAKIRQLRALLDNLTYQEMLLVEEVYSLGVFSQEMLQSKDETEMRAHIDLLASYLIWASHRTFLAHC